MQAAEYSIADIGRFSVTYGTFCHAMINNSHFIFAQYFGWIVDFIFYTEGM